jgi:L-ascorbate metabolism protein UlaG (beta-lactamase superfamily)
MRYFALLLLGTAMFAEIKRPSDEFPSANGIVRITPIRHASLMIEAGNQVVHIDPWSQGNYDGLPKADLILLTHAHGDHFDTNLISRLKKPGTVILAPDVVAKSLPEATVIRIGETKTFGKWTVEAVPMYNLKRGPPEGRLFHEKGQGNGYVLTYGGNRFYISGDTENIPEMHTLKNIDVAFLSMNLPYTMPPEEAAEAVKAFKPKVVYPYHYRGSDLSVFKNALAGTGVEVRIRDWYY